jgi:hypothetical protein
MISHQQLSQFHGRIAVFWQVNFALDQFQKVRSRFLDPSFVFQVNVHAISLLEQLHCHLIVVVLN